MKASIIIPTYNASERLFYNLLALEQQTCSKELYEVIVVDNGSTDDTNNMLSSTSWSFKLDSIFLEKNTGRANGRNQGILASSGDIVIFHDSDMLAGKDFVAKHVDAHKSADMAVCGQCWSRVYSHYYEAFTGYLRKNLASKLMDMGMMNMESLYDKQPLLKQEEVVEGRFLDESFELGRMSAAEQKILDQHGNELEGFYFPWSLFVTSNCSVSKYALAEAGYFDTNFFDWGCEDTDLGYRLYKNKCRFVKDNSIRSIHQEHPINYLDNGIDNIYYFTAKYNSLDLLLFYYGYLIGIDRCKANVIVQEILNIERLGLNCIIDAYRRLLVLLRERSRREHVLEGQCFLELKELREDLVVHKQEIAEELEIVSIIDEGSMFASSFRLLVRNVFNKSFHQLSNFRKKMK